LRTSRRLAGRLLIAYALLGFALVILGALIGLDLAGRVERLSTNADATLAAASRATDAAAGSFENIELSLAEAQASSLAAGTLAQEASATLDALAVAMRISVLGAQPLLPLADEFTTSADQAEELAATLEAVGSSLGDTRTDVARIGPELQALRDQLAGLRGESAGPAASPPLRLFVVLLLAWLLTQAAGSLALIRERPAVTAG
jgi:hypothetical protein